MSSCTGCGRHDDADTPDSVQCHLCPPTVCEDCGGINHIATDRMCSCWISLEGIPYADVKAIFAGDGTFNVGIGGHLSVAESTDSVTR